MRIIPSTDFLNPETYVHDVECLVFDDQGFVTGYKTTSGETYPILTLDEMKTELGITDDPTPSPTVAPTLQPTVAPTVTPTVVTTTVPTVAPTVEPTVAPTTEPVAKVFIKKKSGFTAIYSGNSLVHKYKLKKGVLTWTGKNTKKIKNVKYAGFIKKSQNIIYMTKSGKAYTLSKTGKKKLVVKNGAKFVYKAKFVTKVKTKTGTTNVSNH